MGKIDIFTDNFFFLSNFYPCSVRYKGLIYGSSEAAFQAAKCEDEEQKKVFCSLSPSDAKKFGRQVKLVKDWETIKDKVMYEIVFAKFSQNDYLRKKLIGTYPNELIEGNSWKDTYWGVCNGVGLNKLGKILMSVREALTIFQE